MKVKQAIVAMLCFAMAMGTCACGETGRTGNGSKTDALSHIISEKPLELTFFAKDIVETREENIFTKAYEMTNILLKPVLSVNITDMDHALALAVAAKTTPDIVYDWKQENFNNYGTQGDLIPLNDLIDRYAPNYKKFLKENPDVKHYATAGDGNMYFIPFVLDGVASTGWFIRQDWLDKLELKRPDTIGEFYDVMVAFRDRDPNGNGEKDEVPYFGMKGDIESLLSLFNAYEGFRYEDGTVAYGPLEDEFLPAMREVCKWYREGLIDPDFYTNMDSQDYFTSSNRGGITHEWFGSTGKINERLQETIPGYNLVPFAPPAGPDGVRRELNRRDRCQGEGWAISSLNEYPEETIKFFDFWFTEEGRRLANFGIEGIHYDIVDGKPIIKDHILNSGEGANYWMLKRRAMTDFGFWQDYRFEAQWTVPVAREGIQLYQDEAYLPKQEEKPILSYFGEETRRNVLKTQIDAYRDEMVQYWFFGIKDPVATYGEFKETLQSLGITEYTAIEQRAYDNYLKVVAG